MIERVSSAPVIVLVIILFFKKQNEAVLKSLGGVVESLLSRGFKVGVKGLEMQAEAAAAVTAQEKEQSVTVPGLDVGARLHLQVVEPESKPVVADSTADAQTKPLQAMKSVDVAPIVQEHEALIRANLNKLSGDEHEQVDFLVKSLAVNQLWLRAEYIYRTIFGSQIALLKFLNTARAGTRAQLLQFYENAKAQFPELYANYSFEQYLHYLLSNALITTLPTPGQASEWYSITVAGKEFLKWMTEASVLENKLF